MNVLTVTLLLSLLINSPFDQYGAIRWDDEKARLDNFAIQIQNYEKAVGYILVFDSTGGCAGEAKARAVRAKRYLVERRGIPWNRVIWRHEGYEQEISTILLIAPPGALVPYPYRETFVARVDGPASHTCRMRVERIRRSRW